MSILMNRAKEFTRTSNFVFHKHTKFVTLASEALLRETKYSNNKVLPPVRIEHGTYDFKSDTLLSELTWHLLISLRLLDPYIVMFY